MSIHKVVDDSDQFDIQKHTSVCFNSRLLDEFISEWKIRKQELSVGEISKEEYMEWKSNWPDTADLCGHTVPRKKWKK